MSDAMLISCFSRLKDNRVTDVVEGTSQLPPVVAVENCTPEVATETEHEPNKDSTQVPISPSNGQSRATVGRGHYSYTGGS